MTHQLFMNCPPYWYTLSWIVIGLQLYCLTLKKPFNLLFTIKCYLEIHFYTDRISILVTSLEVNGCVLCLFSTHVHFPQYVLFCPYSN